MHSHPFLPSLRFHFTKKKEIPKGETTTLLNPFPIAPPATLTIRKPLLNSIPRITKANPSWPWQTHLFSPRCPVVSRSTLSTALVQRLSNVWPPVRSSILKCHQNPTRHPCNNIRMPMYLSEKKSLLKSITEISIESYLKR